MKIVHFIFSFQTGGSETMIVDIINEQIRSNAVTLIILNDQVNDTLLNQADRRVRIIKIGRKEKSRNIMPIIRLNWYLFMIKPDVVHCHSSSSAGVILLKRNIVLTVHGVNLQIRNHNRYRKIFAISDAVKKDIEERYNINTFVVYNGINIRKVEAKAEYKFDIFKIIQVSRLDHIKKGQHILIEALNILVNERRISNISVDFIGEGNSLDFLDHLTKAHHLGNHVKFLGLRDRAYIYKHLKNYNLLVQPSLYEGFGLTIVEGMAAKIPVLVSDIDGPSEVVQKGNYGWIFKSGNTHDCAQQILNIIQAYPNVDFIKKIQDSYEYANRSFSIRNTAARYSNEYQNNAT